MSLELERACSYTMSRNSVARSINLNGRSGRVPAAMAATLFDAISMGNEYELRCLIPRLKAKQKL